MMYRQSHHGLNDALGLFCIAGMACPFVLHVKLYGATESA